MKYFAILLLPLLIACGNSQIVYPNMIKSGASDQQRKTDALQCKMQAADFQSKMQGSGSPSFAAVGAIRHKKERNQAIDAANEFYIECMEERGYGKN